MVNEEELDRAVVPMVKFFNENGLPTCMSCQGHNSTNMSMFWIQFEKSVTKDDILDFMKKQLNKFGFFTSCGRFAKRIYGYYNIDTQVWEYCESWNYFAATIDAANEDFRTWQSTENKWDGFNGSAYLKQRERRLNYKSKG